MKKWIIVLIPPTLGLAFVFVLVRSMLVALEGASLLARITFATGTLFLTLSIVTLPVAVLREMRRQSRAQQAGAPPPPRA